MIQAYTKNKMIEKSRQLRKDKWYNYFEAIAPSYRAYRDRFAYYWNDSINYYNYFLTEDNSILEIGCGTGDALAKLKGNKKVGVDFSPKMINIAKENHPSINFYIQDAEHIQLEGTFDVIILSNVIGFFENIIDVLNEIKTYCHSGTKVFVQYHSALWKPILKFGEFLGIKKHMPEQNWLSSGDIENLLYLAGFEVYRNNTSILIPINIPIISWFFNKYLARLPIIKHLCLCQHLSARLLPDGFVDKEYSVSVILPARNESENIEQAILRLPSMGKWTELIIIEGNSTDDTWEQVQNMQQKYPNHKIKIGQQDGKGKYNAVKKGFDMAEGDILMILDGDLTVPPEDLPKFYETLATSKGDFINGSRLVYPMEKNAMRFLNMLGNKFFSFAFSWLLEQPIKDTLCGTKVLFRKDYLKLAENRRFFGDFDPFGDFDLLFGAYKLNLKIIDLPIRYRERVYGETNISRFTHGLILLKMVLFALNKIKFK